MYNSRPSEKCVHTEHCCIQHGCKYGDLDCPVWLGYKGQTYLCDSCLYRIEFVSEKILEERRKEYANPNQ